MKQTTDEIAEYSMELMRLNVQTLFDKEVDALLQKYTEVNRIVASIVPLPFLYEKKILSINSVV